MQQELVLQVSKGRTLHQITQGRHRDAQASPKQELQLRQDRLKERQGATNRELLLLREQGQNRVQETPQARQIAELHREVAEQEEHHQVEGNFNKLTF